MTAPIFHHPDLLDLAASLTGLTVCVAIRVVLYWSGVRRDLLSGLTPLVVLYMAMDCTRRDLHYWELAAFFAWSLFGASFPWDSWRKKLGSKLSSITEVAKAAFQRQQSEAF